MSKSRRAKQKQALARAQPVEPQQKLAAQYVQLTEQFSGPLPPPNLLAQYDDLKPGMADRIVGSFESQTVHRQMLERMVIIGDTYRSYLGLALGFVIELAFLWVAWDLGKSGHDWLAGTIATVDMGAIVTTFITGGKMRQSERESKARAVGLRR